MARALYRWDRDKQEFVDLLQQSKQSEPKIQIVSDEMDATKHMIDGKHYTSKSKFRAVTKAAGHIEVGDDESWKKPVQQQDDFRDLEPDMHKVYDALKAQGNNVEAALSVLKKYH